MAGLRCKEADFRPQWMGLPGEAYDNPMTESFFALLKCELLDNRKLKTKTSAHTAIFEFFEGRHNPSLSSEAVVRSSSLNSAQEPA